MYRLKILCSCLLLMSMSACSNDKKALKEQETSSTQKSLKKDETKDYLYSSDIYEIKLTEEQTSYLDKDINSIHNLVININSMDAEESNKIITEISKNHIQDIKKTADDTLVTSFVGYHGTSYASDKFISIIITESPYVWQSEKQPEIYHSYLFNREDGSLLTQQEFLKALHLEKNTLIAYAKEAIEKNGENLCGTFPSECYQEPKFYDDEYHRQNTTIFMNENNNLVIYVKKQHGLTYNWEPLVLPKKYE